MPKKYKYQEYPKMVYDPENGEHTVVQTADEIPEGWVTKLSDVKDLEQGKELQPASMARLMSLAAGKAADGAEDEPESTSKDKASAKKAAPAKKAPAKKAPAKKAPAKKTASKPSKLDDLELSRQDAIDILKDEKVDYDEDATDDEIADLVAVILEDD